MSVDLNALPRFQLESIPVAAPWTDRNGFALLSLALTVFALFFGKILSTDILASDDRSVATLKNSTKVDHTIGITI